MSDNGKRGYNPFVKWAVVIMTLLIAMAVDHSQSQNRYRQAIERVLAADYANSHGNKPDAEIVNGMEALDLNGCPDDFKRAYIAHTAAWEELIRYESQHESWSGMANDLSKSFFEGLTLRPDKALDDMNAQDKALQQAVSDIGDTWTQVKLIAAHYGAASK